MSMSIFWVGVLVALIVLGPIASWRKEPLWLVLPLLMVSVAFMILRGW